MIRIGIELQEIQGQFFCDQINITPVSGCMQMARGDHDALLYMLCWQIFKKSVSRESDLLMMHSTADKVRGYLLFDINIQRQVHILI